MKRMFGVESFKDQLGNLQNKPLSYKMKARKHDKLVFGFFQSLAPEPPNWDSLNIPIFEPSTFHRCLKSKSIVFLPHMYHKICMGFVN